MNEILMIVFLAPLGILIWIGVVVLGFMAYKFIKEELLDG